MPYENDFFKQRVVRHRNWIVSPPPWIRRLRLARLASVDGMADGDLTRSRPYFPLFFPMNVLSHSPDSLPWIRQAPARHAPIFPMITSFIMGKNRGRCQFPKSTSAVCQSPLQRFARTEIRLAIAPVRQTVGLSFSDRAASRRPASADPRGSCGGTASVG